MKDTGLGMESSEMMIDFKKSLNLTMEAEWIVSITKVISDEPPRPIHILKNVPYRKKEENNGY